MQHSKKQDEMSNLMLRKTQGLHAPLRLVMEKNALKEVGHMPFLHRHNALMDALTGLLSCFIFFLFHVGNLFLNMLIQVGIWTWSLKTF